jgi:hypothetical protein
MPVMPSAPIFEGFSLVAIRIFRIAARWRAVAPYI